MHKVNKILIIVIIIFFQSSIVSASIAKIHEKKSFGNWTSFISSTSYMTTIRMSTHNDISTLNIDFTNNYFSILLVMPSLVNSQNNIKPVLSKGIIKIDGTVYNVQYQLFFDNGMFFSSILNPNKKIIKNCIKGKYIQFIIADPMGNPMMLPFNFSLNGFTSAYKHAKNLYNNLYKKYN